MNFEPTNSHILVNPIEEEQEESNSLIMLPDDYKKPESPYLGLFCPRNSERQQAC